MRSRYSSFSVAFRFTWRIAIKWHSEKMVCGWKGRRKGWKDRLKSFTRGNYCVAPWYSREKLLLGPELELKRGISHFVSTQIAHYPTDEIAATQRLDLNSSRGYCTFPAVNRPRICASPLPRPPGGPPRNVLSSRRNYFNGSELSWLKPINARQCRTMYYYFPTITPAVRRQSHYFLTRER